MKNCAPFAALLLVGVTSAAQADSPFSVGGEYRLKVESLDAPDFDLRPTDEKYTAIGQRGAIHADLRPVAGFRAFVELTAATDAGRKPAERPFDRSRPDVGQAHSRAAAGERRFDLRMSTS